MKQSKKSGVSKRGLVISEGKKHDSLPFKKYTLRKTKPKAEFYDKRGH